MKAHLNAIIDQLGSGVSLTEIRRSLLPEGWEQLLRGCAAASVFDGEIFDGLLRPLAGSGAPPLSELVDLGLIENVANRPDLYRLHDDERGAYMQGWLVGWKGGAPPDDLVALEHKLADLSRERRDHIEELRHLLVANSEQARNLFEKLFTEASGRRDFPRCQDLLDVLADPDRVTLSGPEIARLRLDRAGYVRAQSHWAVDYARCAQYLSPPGLREHADALLAGSGSKVWQVFASPGMGKTMRLRWLVTRHCISAERDVPCARIDFDLVSVANIGRHPWLVLLEAAAQFDYRWSQRSFGKLDEYASFRSLLDRLPSTLAETAAQSIDTLDPGGLEQTITDVFVSRFNDAAADGPALLVVDTLEELLLRGNQEADRLLRLLGRVRQACPGLRLVLAGRYDLRERVPDALESLGEVDHVRVDPFTPQEAEIYLRDMRGIADAEKREVARRRANGRPLTLAVFADAIEQDPTLRPDELAACPNPAMPLLIDRVVRRIDDHAVRWLLRYGVVPRRLREQDLRTVMRTFLVRNMARPNASDDPGRDLHGLPGEEAFPFTTPPDSDAALHEAWLRLLTYVGSSSWVSQAPGDPSAVIFHPDVLGPLRQLVSDQRVYHELHEAFARHFELLAAEDPEQWVAYTREALYHRFQMADPGAGDAWRTALRRARDAGALDDLHEIATEVMGPDYVEDGEPLRTRDGRRLISYGDLADAYVQEAYVWSRRALHDRAGLSDPHWAEAEYALNHVERLRLRAPGSIPVSGQESALQAAMLTVEGRAEEAAMLAEAALAAVGEGEQADLLRVLGDCRAAVGDPSASEVYARAFELTVAAGRFRQAGDIALAYARDRERHGRLDEALIWSERAAGLAAGTADADAARLLNGRLLLRCYRPAAALHSLARSGWATADHAAEVALVRAEAELLLGRGTRALTALDEASGLAENVLGLSRFRLEACAHQLRGVVLGELLAVDEADLRFRQAASMWQEFGFRSGHPECLFLHARFLIRDVGDLNEAAGLLNMARILPENTSGRWITSDNEFVIRTDLLAEELATARGTRSAGHTHVEPPGTAGDTGPRPDRDVPPTITAIRVVHQLVESWWRHNELVPVLADALAALEPPSARLFVLEELRRCPTPRGASEAAVAPLRRVLTTPDRTAHDAEYEPADDALHRALLGEIDRLAGARDRAMQAVDGITAAAEWDAELARWRWLQAMARLGGALNPADAAVGAVSSDRPPLLHAAGLLLTATSPPSSAERGVSIPLLVEAIKACRLVGRPTRWAADVLHTYAMVADEEAAYTEASHLYRRLGQKQEPESTIDGRLLIADRHGEEAVQLTAPRELPVGDLEALQRLLLVEDGLAVVRALQEALPDAFRKSAGHGTTALRLESDDPNIQALPWELALSGLAEAEAPRTLFAYRSLPAAAAGADIRYVQAALRGSVDPDLPVDGILGPRTRLAIARLTASLGLDESAPIERGTLERLARGRPRLRTEQQPLAVIVRPSSAIQSQSRGSHEAFGVDVADIYASHGFDIRSVGSVHLDRPNPWVPRASVVHVTAPLEAIGRSPYLDLSPSYSESRFELKSRGADLSAGSLAGWLGMMEPGSSPLVVLDPPFPGSSADIPEQLLRRNLFAAQFFTELPTAAVLCMGLSMYETYPAVDHLAEGVAEGRSLAAMVAGLRARSARDSAAGPGRPDWLAARAIALFAAPTTYTLP
ncbi:hypothetical protein ACFC0D_19405 [Streptomyces sp. NPDC056222]|uniref:hypothetical protein n=1 Tax=Streptomyces sp. NPDC056222 TaxID=3345749 RepID=UPI0035E32F19